MARETAIGRQNGVALEQSIYDLVRRAIFEHRLPPGTHLPEETLAAIFGVNRQRIRRVLLRLAHDKMVDLRPNRGATVAQPSPKEARDLFTVRTALEELAIRELVGSLSAEHAARLAEHVAAERTAFEQGDRHTMIRLSGQFHILLASLTGNMVLEELIRGLVARSSLLLALYGGSNEELCSHLEHQELLEAIVDGDRQRATQLMDAHLNGIAQRLHLSEPASTAANLSAIFRDLMALPTTPAAPQPR
jgi:DNA-binding GntR family transcriptional regulator